MFVRRVKETAETLHCQSGNCRTFRAAVPMAVRQVIVVVMTERRVQDRPPSCDRITTKMGETWVVC